MVLQPHQWFLTILKSEWFCAVHFVRDYLTPPLESNLKKSFNVDLDSNLKKFQYVPSPRDNSYLRLKLPTWVNSI